MSGRRKKAVMSKAQNAAAASAARVRKLRQLADEKLKAQAADQPKATKPNPYQRLLDRIDEANKAGRSD